MHSSECCHFVIITLVATICTSYWNSEIKKTVERSSQGRKWNLVTIFVSVVGTHILCRQGVWKFKDGRIWNLSILERTTVFIFHNMIWMCNTIKDNICNKFINIFIITYKSIDVLCSMLYRSFCGTSKAKCHLLSFLVCQNINVWRTIVVIAPASLLSPCNALRRGYSNAAVVLSVSVSVFPSRFDLMKMIKTKPLTLCAYSSNLVDMITMTRG